MKTINQLRKKDLLNKKVLVRVDYNVPLKVGKITETTRIDQSLATIQYLLDNGARVLLISHLGDDGGKSLAPVVKYLTQFISVKLVKKLNDPKIESYLNSGQVIIFENIRQYEGEKKNDPIFAKQLASLADIYINDAFSVSHRAHASVSAIAKYLPSYAGLAFVRELKNLGLALKPKKPLTVILGGAKFKTKIPLVKKFSQTAENIFIVGALGNSFMKTMGCDVGNSVVEEDISYIKPFLKKKNIIVPLDVVLNKKNQIVDIGPETLDLIKTKVAKSKMIIWNGPAGWFELGAKEGTISIAKIIAESKALSLVGGGDTLSAIKELKLLDKFTFVSSAGGAMLDFIASGTLPGIKALK